MRNSKLALFCALVAFALTPFLARVYASPEPGKILDEVREGNKSRDAQRANQSTNDEARINTLAQEKAKAMVAATQPSTDRIHQLEAELSRTKADLIEARAAVAGLTAERDALRRQLRGE